MNCPPTKRLRGLNQEVVTAGTFDDPFGDDEDFTQDDLDEIDTIASQAITSASAGGGVGSNPVSKSTEPDRGSTWPLSTGQSNTINRATTNQSRGNTFRFNSSIRGNAGLSSREPLVNRQQQFGSDRGEAYSLLEAQHAELKRKLKEVEEEIMVKSGEIRVLRDSLKAAQQEKEAQRQNQLLLEMQKQKEQSDKEKELNRKVQSLQSELQFKEAEINEMKTKLHSSDRNKTASPLPRNSPKVQSALAQTHHGSSSSSSSSPIGNGFLTKEVFGAQVSSRRTPVKTPLKTRKDDRTASSSRSSDRQEVSRLDPFLSIRPAPLQHRGGILLGLLLQQPLSSSSLGLSHLLSMNLTDIHLTSNRLSGGFLLHSDASVGVSRAPRAALNPVQSLAVTGLNMLSQNRPAAKASSRNNRSCPGAVLLLPLLDLHLSQFCQTLDSLRSASAASSGSDSSAATSLPASCTASAGLGKLDDAGLSGFSVEDTGLAALRLLHFLLAHSDEVVEAVLSKETQNKLADNKTDHSFAGLGLCSQNALLQSLLRLCDACVGSSSSQKELVLNAMKTLCLLIERTPHTHTHRLQCVLQVLCMYVSTDSRLHTVSECVSIFTSMSDHETLAKQLRSQHEPCVFLKLFQYIRARPDNQAANIDWVKLDLQVIRLLSRLMTQRAESWSTDLQSTCQCYTELVQTVVIIFHRQWLDLRGTQEPSDSTGSALPLQCHSLPWWRGPAASLLRECLLLLHWLLLHHGSFSESCRPLLHMYDQVIPAVRDTLRKIPELSESEELALEEICRSEGDDTDDMDTDTGS
ncbi:ATR-interacting protein isoform X2 [Parambassis ranga]|uniref:ATR-interacting protein isoform X2 n=1 Tax=Parambassis ranga TaxID=210632 RepID=A0A6P7I1E8_9TELE|nr:ATR-interacting protein isoform X2 [Parambassis ranga]